MLLIPAATVGGGIQFPLGFRLQLQSFRFTPAPGHPPAVLGTERNQNPLTHEFPSHFLGQLNSGTYSVVPTPACEKFNCAAPGPTYWRVVGKGQAAHAK